MLRLFANRGFYELCKASHFAAACVTKRQVTRFLPVSSTSHPRLHIPARPFNTGIPGRKDALQTKEDIPEDTKTLDLDKWKSVMRAQASEEKQVSDKEEACDDNDDLTEPGVDSKDNSLEESRDLVAMWRQAGKLVPEEMTDEEVRALAELTTKSSRRKYLRHLSIKEGHKKFRKEKQEKKKAEREVTREELLPKEDVELGNQLFLKLWDRTIDKHTAWRSVQAMRFGQPLVFDMSYASAMARRELENTVHQLMEVESWNRRDTEPYNLHLCNLQADGTYQKELLKQYGADVWDRMLINSSDKHYIDLFPREQLVYLTADSPNILRTFDHSKVYIIGALVDRSSQPGLSLANAKRLNLATARLPLDQYLHWQIGAKNLTLDQMMRIMLSIKETGKWEEALKFVPKRKFDGFHHERTQQEIPQNRVKGNYRPREDGEKPFRSGERTFHNEGQSLYKTHKESGFSGSDREKISQPSATSVRTSFESNIEGRRNDGKGKVWWNDE
ncbi:tRNA methyltransferase 10 homolog C [Gymnodraco acuticeps]|uniref:tRNA methyltransferase 10 homolog C n=1 Tax=Gymnodraco acuticeps TaxID=8218 RepID=A0A6P8VE37_GYMAC|nr:tRNA methyltransferase 10 homolog C [Gymnodraco acuticeps]